MIQFRWITLFLLSLSVVLAKTAPGPENAYVGAKMYFSSYTTGFEGSWPSVSCGHDISRIPDDVIQSATVDNMVHYVDFGGSNYWRAEPRSSTLAPELQKGQIQIYFTAKQVGVHYRLSFDFALLIPAGKTLDNAIGCVAL